MTIDPPDNDQDLRQAFAELRRSDADQTPSRADVMARGVAAAPAGRLVPVLASALAVACMVASIVVSLQLGRPPRPSPFLAATEAWTAPTDFLLRTPGSEILGSVPPIGTRRSLHALDGAGALPGSNGRSASP